MIVLEIVLQVLGIFAVYAIAGYVWGKYVYVVLTYNDDATGVLAGIFWPLSFPVYIMGAIATQIIGRSLMQIDAGYEAYLRKLRK